VDDGDDYDVKICIAPSKPAQAGSRGVCSTGRLAKSGHEEISFKYALKR
jgi:hypothetical protein